MLALGTKQHSGNPRVQFHKLDVLEKPKKREITYFGDVGGLPIAKERVGMPVEFHLVPNFKVQLKYYSFCDYNIIVQISIIEG